MDQDNTTWTVARTPGVMRETVCTVVHQRTASLDSERGIDDDSEVHDGKAPSEITGLPAGLEKIRCPEVCSGKASVLSGRQSHQGKSQNLVAWIAERRETEFPKPIDKAIFKDGEQVIGPWSSRQSCESSGVKVLVPSIACIRAVSMSGACGGNEARSART